jgi:hypothetical protein
MYTKEKHSKKKFCSNSCRVPWNKGELNLQAAENGRKGADKQRQTVTGRKKVYKDDGVWTWVYPDQ